MSAKYEKTITVLGGGAMGTLCCLLLAENASRIRWWGRSPSTMADIARARENRRYLPGYALSDSVRVTSDPADALDGADLLVVAIPCQFIRNALVELCEFVSPTTEAISVAKGIEVGTLLRPTEIIRDVLEERPTATLSGPSIAPEVAAGLPAALVAAGADDHLAETVQRLFSTKTVRVYTNRDVVGVELAGAMKNVIALAAGMIDGLAMGHNAKASLLARGLVEISRLGDAMGASRETFAGLAGLGDLVTTCFSPMGRNRSAGEAFGQGKTLDEVTAATISVIEGIPTTRSVLALAKLENVEMPITRAVHDVIFEGKDPRHAIADLMAREKKTELD